MSGNLYCFDCYEEMKNKPNVPIRHVFADDVKYNEPGHYHQHEIDTIKFLQEGFPSEVFAHFCVANITKYAQRYPYKNGREDLVKLVDYAKRLLAWHDEVENRKKAPK